VLGAGVATAALAARCLALPDQAAGRLPSVMLVWGAFTALTLLSLKAVFFLPGFLALALMAGFPGGGPRRDPEVLFFPGLLAAFGLGLLLSWWRSPQESLAELSGLLRPLLGSRWQGNGLWLAITTGLLAAARPAALGILTRRRQRWRRPGAGQVRDVILLLAATLPALGLLVGLASPGSPFLAGYLLWVSLPYLGVACLLGAVSTGRSRSWPWLTAALLALLLAWRLTPERATGLTDGLNHGPGLESCLAATGQEDLLLLPAGDESRYHVPLDRAGRGNILTYDTDGELRRFLEDPEPVRSYRRILVLHPEARTRPWLETHPGPDGRPLGAGTPPHSLILKEFLPRNLPEPVVIFADGAWTGTVRRVTGMQADGVWTEGRLELSFHLEGTEAESLTLVLRGWRPDAAPDLRLGLTAALNGRLLAADKLEKTFVSYALEPGDLHQGTNTLLLEVPVFVPARLSSRSSDARALGLDLESLILR
jgi:hypothetical protein